jgi:hypothetical protein
MAAGSHRQPHCELTSVAQTCSCMMLLGADESAPIGGSCEALFPVDDISRRSSRWRA